ncbi:agmatine deiminase family protein [Magnetococcales bacterium HHB-1]
MPVQAELIVLAAPAMDDSYYAKVAEDIFQFHVGFAKKIHPKDQLLILTDEASYDDYVDVFGEEQVVIAPMLDIWMRDFTTVNATMPTMFRYTAAGQGGGGSGQREADRVQDPVAVMLEEAEANFQSTDLLNDGGNWVDDGAGYVVISRKFLKDNRLSESEARDQIIQLTGAKAVAFIEADEQGGLEHADGVVSFIDTNTLIINSYPEDPEYAKQLKDNLRQNLPGVKIHEIITPYDGSKIYDEKFGSACGLYTNALVTPKRIYFPQFGIPEDKIALKQIRAISKKEIIPISSQQVCFMGGGVRCMSWQLRGDMAEAILDYFDMRE